MSNASMRARLMKLRAARPAPLTDEALQAEFAQLVALRDAQKAGDNMAASMAADAVELDALISAVRAADLSSYA